MIDDRLKKGDEITAVQVRDMDVILGDLLGEYPLLVKHVDSDTVTFEDWNAVYEVNRKDIVMIVRAKGELG
jgi:hypothetical protein